MPKSGLDKVQGELLVRDIVEKVTQISDNYTLIRYPRDIMKLDSILDITDIHPESYKVADSLLIFEKDEVKYFDDNMIIGIVNTDTDIRLNSAVSCDGSHPNIISNN